MPESRKANQAVVDVVAVAAEKQATPAQIALAWLLGPKSVSATDRATIVSESSSSKAL